MDERIMQCIMQIEQHLAVIAEAATMKVKRATSKEKTVERKREIRDTDIPSQGAIDLCKRSGLNLAVEWPKFKHYCKANGVQYVNFDSAFKKWLLIANGKQGGLL